MDKIVFHGSPDGNIVELQKRKSTHGKECIYATDNETIALLFSSRGNGDLDYVIGIKDDTPFVVERRKDVFKNLYDKSGYIYWLDGKNFNHYDYLWRPEVISFEQEKIIGKRKVENILEELRQKHASGEIVLYDYPNRPDNIPLDNSDLIKKYKRYYDNGMTRAIDNLLKIYPEFSESFDNVV